MDALLGDIRFALRTLRKAKGFTAVAVLTLALGIGANTTIFSVIEGVLLRPLPYPNPAELAVLSGTNAERHLTGILVSLTKLTRIQEQTHTFQAIGGFFANSVVFSTGGTPEQVSSIRASRNLFDILGVRVRQGRAFLPAEDRSGAAEVAMISDGFWHSHFGGSPDVIGRSVTVDGVSTTIVGVLPASFRFPFLDPEPDLFLPRLDEYPFLDQTRIRSGAGYLTIVGRLQPGITLAQAQGEINTINDGYWHDFPGYADAGKWNLDVASMQDSLVGTLRPSLLALLAAVGFVLLIVCANVASLLLSRTTARSREIAVRRALGASQWRLMRQLLTESVVLSASGGILGVLLTYESLPLLRLLPPGTIPRLQEIKVDTGVLWFTAVLCLVTGIAFGLLPSAQAARRGLHDDLKEAGRGGPAGGKGGRIRSLLVVGEVAVAVMLLTGTGLLIRSFARLLLVNPGFDASGVLTLTMTLPDSRYPKPEQTAEFYRRLVERVQALPGVESAAVVSYLPLAGPVRLVYFCPEGTVCQGVGKDPIVAVRQITPDYLKTMRTSLLRGRVFTEHDAAGTAPVVIINDTIAKRYFADQDPIGRHLIESRDRIPMEIVGVVRSVKFNSLNVPSSEEIYKPQAQAPFPTMSLVVRSDSDPGPLASALRREVLAMDPGLPAPNVRPMEEVVSASVAQPRLTAQCAGIFAALAVTLALIGIYGVMAYSVAQRIPEMGLRLALGANPREVLALVLRQGLRLVLAGVALGTLASLGLTKLLAALLFETDVRDPLTFAGVPVLLMAVALLACYLPARRASRVDPIVALRYE